MRCFLLLKQLYRLMEIEGTTTAKNFKSEELQNFSLNSIVILHSTKVIRHYLFILFENHMQKKIDVILILLLHFAG